MKLVNYSNRSSKKLAWMWTPEELVDVGRACEAMGELAFPEVEIQSVLEGPETLEQLHRLAENFAELELKDRRRAARAKVSTEGIRWFAPIPRPEKIVCVGLNYRDHAEEQGAKLPEEPLLFAKFATAVVGNRDDVLKPVETEKLDHEVELAVVIGKVCTKVRESEAYDFVAGYTVLNDISARDFQSRDKQWLRAKSCDTFAPMGPCLVTRDELSDPHSLNVRLAVNGQERQSSNTKNLIFNVPSLVSFVSRFITLKPGDVISTGTPGGVGVFRNPPVFLQDGDQMCAEIDGIGRLENRVRYLD